MSSNPVPYFSNLVANAEPTHSNPKTSTTVYKKTALTYRPFLGLPCYSTYKLVRQPVSTTTTDIQQILTQSKPEVETRKVDNSILGQVETPRIIEKQWKDINQPNFLTLAAATNTVEKFVRCAKKTATALNVSKPPTKKRKPDIFDL